jgi:outer membrane protein TolC
MNRGRRHVWAWLASVLCFVGVVRADSSAGLAVFDLPELVDSAVQFFPSVEAAQHAIEAAQSKLTEATFSPFFQFNALGTVGIAPEVEGSPILSPDSQFPVQNPWRPVGRIGAEGVVPIYTFGKLTALRDAARAGLRAATYDKERTILQLRYDVRRAYYALQFALDLRQMFAEGRKPLRKAVQHMRERIARGEEGANEMERSRIASALGEVDGRASEALRLEEISWVALRTLTGKQHFRVPDCPLVPINMVVLNADFYVARAIQLRPDLLMLRQAIRARGAQLQGRTAALFPDIGVAASASKSHAPGITDQTNPFVIDDANYASVRAGLIAKWSLDVPGNLARRSQAKAELDQTQAKLREALLGIELEVNTIYQRVLDTQRRERAWYEARREARSWFVGAAAANDLGTVEPRDFVDSARAYFTTRTNHIESIRDFNTTIAELEKVVGGPVVPHDRWKTSCE